MHHPKGSIWRKWDLHFHTPASYDYHDMSVSNEVIIDSLVSAGIRVVAITDHHVIDVDRIRALQNLGTGKITVLPGIEFCSELGGHHSVHFIGIFHEDSDIDYIWHDLSVTLKLTEKDIKRRGGYERIYTDLKEASKLIRSYNGLVSVHAGTKSNTLETISSKVSYKQAIKSDLLKDHIVDILEIGKTEDLRIYKEIVFPQLQEHLPVIICSDNHRASDYRFECNCWIKADPSFYDLLQTLVEPDSRIFIGAKPPKRERVASNRTKYIRSIHIRKKASSDLDEIWFDDVSLDLNHDLVAIIGNKGTGKSALAEVIGLLGNSQHEDRFDFLNSQRFRTPRNNRSQHFEATLHWENDTVDQKSLNESVNPRQREKVKFIPQGLFEEICNDIATGKDSKFNAELEKVIFSHVTEADRLGKDSLGELLGYLTDETYDAIEILKTRLHDINASIAEIEEKLTPEYRENLENLHDSKRAELVAHESAKPVEVPQPEASTDTTMAHIADQLGKANHDLAQLTLELGEVQQQEKQAALIVSASGRALEQIENFRETYRLFREDLSEELAVIGVSFDQIVELKIDPDPILEKRKPACSVSKPPGHLNRLE